MKQKRYIRLSPDFDVLYIDQKSCCYDAYGDEIYNDNLELGPLFCFAMPGIEEWQKRYMYATDFSKTTTDPSFDWLTWHYEGLCFAKAIWEQMPKAFTLYYKAPYEDRSQTILGEIEINEHIDILIDQLKARASHQVSAPSFTNQIDFKAKRGENEVLLSFQLNRLQTEVSIPFNQLSGIRYWLKEIITGNQSTCSLYPSRFCLHFFRQTIGSHPEMGQFWIENSHTHDKPFQAYVNIKNFIKGLYLSVLTELGFHIYKDMNNYPSEDERNSAWKPYNQLKSRQIESYITDQRPMKDEDNTSVNETYVMFPEWGGCIFWDTMEVGSGNDECIYRDENSGSDIKLNIPGLKKWSEFYDNHDDSQSFEEYWHEGWELAKLVRKQLPEHIDLFYMCYDPKQPDAIINYHYELPKIVVPKQ